MTKPMPIGCFQHKNEIPTMTQFNMILETVNLEDKRGHVFSVDIEFDKKRANKKTPMFKGVYCPTFEEKEALGPAKKSTFHLLEIAMQGKNKNDILLYKATIKAHATTLEKPFLSTSNIFNF